MTEVSSMTVKKENAVCDKHGEYEAKVLFIRDKAVNQTFCPNCQSELEEQRKAAEAIAKKRQVDWKFIEKRNESHSKSRIPRRFKESRFETFKTETDQQKKVLGACQDYAANWEAVKEAGTSLIFLGKVGAGKTHLACSIAYEVSEKAGFPLFISVSEMMREIKSAFNKDSDKTEQEFIDNFASVGLLILDELGMDYGTEFNKALLFEVLNRRYEAMSPSILISNLDAAALREYLGERLFDRMRDNGGKLLTFVWDSHRGKN